jgi:hypothetical protein
MCIYCGTNKYRKIYENHHGPIPKDSSGRTYHIHHVDGNHENNDPKNLKCVSIQEHYDIHHSQGDWAACLKLASSMKISATEISKIAKLNAKTRLEKGTHHFLDKNVQRSMQEKRIQNNTHNFLGGAVSRRNNLKRVASGAHPFLGGEIARKSNEDRIAAENHHFLDKLWQKNKSQSQIENGTHNFLGEKNPAKRKWTCTKCGKTGTGISNYNRWHENNCRTSL